LIGGEQAIDALADPNELAPESILTSFGRIGLACGGEPSGDLALNELRILEQSHDFGPDDLVKKVLAHRLAVTNELAKASVGIGPEATIIVDLARG
jgi:hypothetical protein